MALAVATGVALWLLPAQPIPEPPAPAVAAEPRVVIRPAAVMRTSDAGTGPPRRTAADAPGTSRTAAHAGLPGDGPAGFVTFVDAVRDPASDLTEAGRRAGVRWYTLGHITDAGDPCTPRWGGMSEREHDSVADRILRLGERGAEAILAFGGPAGRELSAACEDETLLLAAYRRVIDHYDVTAIDFEVRDSADTVATRRRAAAIAALQREARDQGRTLTVIFTLPVGPAGLSAADTDMLRATRQAGAEIGMVNLLVPFRPAADGNVARTMVTAKAAHAQIGWALGLTGGACWRRMGLTPVLADADDLSMARARLLAGFQAETGLRALSVRGARPPAAVLRLLAASGG